MQRRRFLMTALLAFGAGKVIAGPKYSDYRGFEHLLNDLSVPLEIVPDVARSELQQWKNSLPYKADYASLQSYFKQMIKQDYLEDRTRIAQGCILSESEFMLYCYKRTYA